MRLSNRTRPDESGLLGVERRAAKICSDSSFERTDVLRGLQQAFAPPSQKRCDLVGVFFTDEFIESGLCLEQRGVEQCLAAIVRMDVKVGFGRTVVRIERKREPAEACGNKGRRCALTTPDQETAAAEVDWMRADKMTCLLPPTQRKAPRVVFVESKI